MSDLDQSPDASDAPVAEVRGLEIRVPGGPVLLRPVSLTVPAGRITALTGPSGSGKTTLLRALTGHLPEGAAVTAGTLEVLGTEPGSLGAEELRLLRRNRVAYVGQDPGSALNPRMRIRRIVAETATDPGAAAVLALLRECLLPVDDGLPDRRPTAVSGGQQRRVALARALAREPELLLLDEPTAGLDPALRDEIGVLLRHLAAARGLTVVMACHDPELVEACADRVVRLPGPPVPVPESPSVPRPPGPPAAPGPAGSGSGLRARGVGVAFAHRAGRHRALDSVDFDAEPGTATAVVGPSGSGKTTLLRVLAGLHPADSGTLTLDGVPLAATARRRTREHRRRVQLVPQNPLDALNPARTVGSALARPLRLHGGLRGPRSAAEVARLLEQVELPAGFAGRYPAELSGGQRQRVSLARALATAPDVLLCDEITSALDPDTSVAVMELLRRLRTERRMTVVLVSHEPHLVAAYTRTAHLLEAGRLSASGPTEKVLTGL
ncbi:ABC transporter ATP-binding protein [Streptomyces lavendulae]|uniref:Glutathione import ATP-binding protein GsiA n=1 Tax=Streptomyces lavendulae subsp. lavendulae TaxID=58340 RepID=A0A2K8PNM0_STRLA|nr:ATP-binding cassette domain-containing protein [Streptomyces lavendulae]ATZ28068.1 Glutathione import ATP-binding protein GsiA [Streptomyces lavendulae subsp. lavendulae]QUQ57896.1 Glutathione import ATP-binding protein GsiA [Streptomyces lavendulae subsp. lavendulae]